MQVCDISPATFATFTRIMNRRDACFVCVASKRSCEMEVFIVSGPRGLDTIWLSGDAREASYVSGLRGLDSVWRTPYPRSHPASLSPATTSLLFCFLEGPMTTYIGIDVSKASHTLAPMSRALRLRYKKANRLPTFQIDNSHAGFNQ